MNDPGYNMVYLYNGSYIFVELYNGVENFMVYKRSLYSRSMSILHLAVL